MKPSDDTYSEQETIARREAILKRMLATPPKRHEPLKVREDGAPKGKAKPSKEAR